MWPPLPQPGCRGEWKETGKKTGGLGQGQCNRTASNGNRNSNDTDKENTQHKQQEWREPLSPPAAARAPEPQESSRRPAHPQPETSVRAHGMEYPAPFGQVGSSRPAVSLPGFW